MTTKEKLETIGNEGRLKLLSLLDLALFLKSWVPPTSVEEASPLYFGNWRCSRGSLSSLSHSQLRGTTRVPGPTCPGTLEHQVHFKMIIILKNGVRIEGHTNDYCRYKELE